MKYIKTRIFTNWGGYSQCKYQKALINTCIDSGKHYDRVFFISGLDYPLWSNKRILEYLSIHQKDELIKGMDITTCHSPQSKQERFTIYHFFRDLPVKNLYLKRIFSGCSRQVMKLLPIRKKNFITDGEKQLHIYQGSSWWGLTYNCLKYVASQMNRPIFENYFKYSFAPDEMLIQTIVFNSPFASKCWLYEGPWIGLTILTPLHYIEYFEEVRTFTETDYDKLIQSNKMFARKLRTTISDKLLEQIDNYRQL